MTTKGLVESLCQTYDTRDPFEIARQRKVIVLHEPLGSIHGYYAKSHRQQAIHINQALDGRTQSFTCAHELAHSILHAGIHTPFLRACTLLSVDKLELEANRFAADLTFSDHDLQPFLSCSITEAANYMGLPIPLAEYRMSTVPHTHLQFE